MVVTLLVVFMGVVSEWIKRQNQSNHTLLNSIFRKMNELYLHVKHTLCLYFIMGRSGIYLTRWGRVTHTCVSKVTIIGSYNDLSPSRRQAIFWINAGILSIGPSWMDFCEILIEIDTFSFKKMRLKLSSAKWRPFCQSLNVLSWVAAWHRGEAAGF